MRLSALGWFSVQAPKEITFARREITAGVLFVLEKQASSRRGLSLWAHEKRPARFAERVTQKELERLGKNNWFATSGQRSNELATLAEG